MTLWVIFDASSTRKPLPQLTSKPTFACTATSDGGEPTGRPKSDYKL